MVCERHAAAFRGNHVFCGVQPEHRVIRPARLCARIDGRHQKTGIRVVFQILDAICRIAGFGKAFFRTADFAVCRQRRGQFRPRIARHDLPVVVGSRFVAVDAVSHQHRRLARRIRQAGDAVDAAAAVPVFDRAAVVFHAGCIIFADVGQSGELHDAVRLGVHVHPVNPSGVKPGDEESVFPAFGFAECCEDTPADGILFVFKRTDDGSIRRRSDTPEVAGQAGDGTDRVPLQIDFQEHGGKRNIEICAVRRDALHMTDAVSAGKDLIRP